MRDGMVTNVLRVTRDEDGGRGGDGFVVGGEGGFDGLVVGGSGGSGGEGFEVSGGEGVGRDIGGTGDVGNGIEIGGTVFEEEIGGIGLVVGPGGTIDDIVVLKKGGIGSDDCIGGTGLVVRTGGTITVVLKTGGEGPTVGTLRVGKVNVGIEGVEDSVGLDVGSGGTAVELTNGGEIGGSGLVVGRGGTTVELRVGGEGLIVGRLIVGRGLDVGKGGIRVELVIGGEGPAVGRVSVGKPLELKLGGGGGGRNVGNDIVGMGGRGVTGRVEFSIGAVGIPMKVVGSGSDKLGGGTGGFEDGPGHETFTLGSGRVNEGRAVGRTVGRVMFGGKGSESVGIGMREPVGGIPKLRDAGTEADDKDTQVEGRGMPEGRLHVRFCAATMLDSPSNVERAATNMMAVNATSRINRPARTACFTNLQP